MPELIAAAGPEITETYIDFLTATIRNRNTRQAYARACWQFFDWCAAHGLQLTTVRPFQIDWLFDVAESRVLSIMVGGIWCGVRALVKCRRRTILAAFLLLHHPVGLATCGEALVCSKLNPPPNALEGAVTSQNYTFIYASYYERDLPTMILLQSTLL
jgi:hypothetical protein